MQTDRWTITPNGDDEILRVTPEKKVLIRSGQEMVDTGLFYHEPIEPGPDALTQMLRFMCAEYLKAKSLRPEAREIEHPLDPMAVARLEAIEECARVCIIYADVSDSEASAANDAGLDEISNWERAQAEAARELAETIRSLKYSSRPQNGSPEDKA